MTRSGAPRHGDSGAVSTATSAASSQPPSPIARASAAKKNTANAAAASGSKPFSAKANRRSRTT